MAARELTRPRQRDEAPIPHSKRLHLNAVRNADSGLPQPPRRAVLTLPPVSSCLGSPARPPNSATAMASHVGGRLRICGAKAPRKPSCELGTKRGPSFLICRAADSPQALIRGPSSDERQEWVVTCRSEFTRPARRSSREQTFAHWRRGMGSQSSFRQPGLAHSVRQKRYRRGDEKSAGNGLLNSASTRRREPRLSNTRSR